ncbi:hypothetical protein [uncultured Veillonella sp.]|uniref:hypothetical protein n=1 Tax=uncultured Veillonella sp. TaxID=159268 RepID=UPI002593F978|nr:hypothetical protein [uncultured Veillonella sp.]
MKIKIEISVDEFKALIQKEPCCEQGSIVVKNKIGMDQEKLKEALEKELKKKLIRGFQ